MVPVLPLTPIDEMQMSLVTRTLFMASAIVRIVSEKKVIVAHGQSTMPRQLTTASQRRNVDARASSVMPSACSTWGRHGRHILVRPPRRGREGIRHYIIYRTRYFIIYRIRHFIIYSMSTCCIQFVNYIIPYVL